MDRLAFRGRLVDKGIGQSANSIAIDSRFDSISGFVGRLLAPTTSAIAVRPAGSGTVVKIEQHAGVRP
jgi:hypothetical protein